MARDPICGIEIDEKKAPGKSEYKGTRLTTSALMPVRVRLIRTLKNL